MLCQLMCFHLPYTFPVCAQGDADLELPEVPEEELPEVPEQEPGLCFLLCCFCSKYYAYSAQYANA